MRYYFRNMVLPGVGLHLEDYVLFFIGSLERLFDKGFSHCWKSEMTCDPTCIAAVEYFDTCSIIFGQILVDMLGDWLGRRQCLIQDTTIMFLGLLVMTATWCGTHNGSVICYVLSLFFYGIGIGSEQPVTRHMPNWKTVQFGKISKNENRLPCGRKVISALLM